MTSDADQMKIAKQNADEITIAHTDGHQIVFEAVPGPRGGKVLKYSAKSIWNARAMPMDESATLDAARVIAQDALKSGLA